MNSLKREAVVAVSALALCCAAVTATALAHSDKVGKIRIKEQGVFFVGGKYNDPASPAYMSGQMYVRYQVPSGYEKGKPGKKQTKYPVVMVHGGTQQGTNFTSTPDGRPGWADYFLQEGWPVYVVDQPGRGRSPYITPAYGTRGGPGVVRTENLFTAPERVREYPQARKHTQWPGAGIHGDKSFDQFFASQWGGMETLKQEETTSAALIALLEKIGPAILLVHSQSGPHGWVAADKRPDLVKAMVVVEPNGPPFYGESNSTIERPWGFSRLPLTFSPAANAPSDLKIQQEARPEGADLFRCWRQQEPARKLTRLAGIPILLLTGEGSFRAQYDHCTSRFLTQAGVKNKHVRLETVGIRGNGHMMMLEKNNLKIAAFMEDWLSDALSRR